MVVRADASQYEGWFYEGAGIYLHVWLNQYNNLHIASDDLIVHTTTHKNSARANVGVTIRNQNFMNKNCLIGAFVTGRDGKIVGRSKELPMLLEAGKEATVKQVVTIANPVLWSTQDPYLYRVI